MWMEFVYEPTTLFSLKASEATNAAGKSLLSPSPYAVKMALLNAICTYDSVDVAREHFDLIRDLDLQFALPEYIVVNNCFIRIMQESRSETRKENPNIMFKSTVVFREFVYFSGKVRIAAKLSDQSSEEQEDFLERYFVRVNYFGKRGCFFQLREWGALPGDQLPREYSQPIENKSSFADGRSKILARVDDFGSKATFDKVSNYSNEKTDRVSKIIALPYRVMKSTKAFTLLQMQ